MKCFKSGFIGALFTVPFVATGYCLAAHLILKDLDFLALAIGCYFAGALLDGVRMARNEEDRDAHRVHPPA